MQGTMTSLDQVSCVLITREKEYPKEISTEGFGEVLIATESPSVYQRYLLAAKAKHDIIYVQDDDCTLDYRELFSHYNGCLTNAMTMHHLQAYMGSGCTLVGWGCFFPKEMLKAFDRYIAKYGEDAHLMREADRIFTVLNQPHNTVIMPHHDFTAQTNRMWNQSEHWTSMAEAIKKASALLY